MAKSWKIGPRYVTGHGALILCLGLATCVLSSLMTSSPFAEMGYFIAVALSISCLLIVGIELGKSVLGERPHCPPGNYFVVGLMSIVCGCLFWLLGSAPTELRLLSLLVGAHGVIWGLWYFRLAFYLKSFPQKAALLSILAATTAFLGIAIAKEPELTQIRAVALAAYYAMFLGIQIFVTAAYLYREFETEDWSLRRHNNEASEVHLHESSRTPIVHIIVTPEGANENPARVTLN